MSTRMCMANVIILSLGAVILRVKYLLWMCCNYLITSCQMPHAWRLAALARQRIYQQATEGLIGLWGMVGRWWVVVFGDRGHCSLNALMSACIISWNCFHQSLVLSFACVFAVALRIVLMINFTIAFTIACIIRFHHPWVLWLVGFIITFIACWHYCSRYCVYFCFRWLLS